jgi:alkylation response protein AidB-like acyl-CoA dehydrogenase
MFGSINRRTVLRAAARLYTSHSALPEEHKMVYDMCRKFADEVLAPSAGEWDKKHSFPKEAVVQLVSAKYRPGLESIEPELSVKQTK